MFYQAALAFWNVVARFHRFAEAHEADAVTAMWAV